MCSVFLPNSGTLSAENNNSQPFFRVQPSLVSQVCEISPSQHPISGVLDLLPKGRPRFNLQGESTWYLGHQSAAPLTVQYSNEESDGVCW